MLPSNVCKYRDSDSSSTAISDSILSNGVDIRCWQFQDAKMRQCGDACFCSQIRERPCKSLLSQFDECQASGWGLWRICWRLHWLGAKNSQKNALVLSPGGSTVILHWISAEIRLTGREWLAIHDRVPGAFSKLGNWTLKFPVWAGLIMWSSEKSAPTDRNKMVKTHAAYHAGAIILLLKILIGKVMKNDSY